MKRESDLNEVSWVFKRNLWSEDKPLIRAFALPGYVAAELMDSPGGISQGCYFLRFTTTFVGTDWSLFFPGS